jgi:gentisate 1,2-dioxygenase
MDAEAIDPGKFAAAMSIAEVHSLLAAAGMGAGWNKPEPSLWPTPRRTFLPAHWSYGLAKAALDAAGKFVSTEFAERRNLILNNPVPGNSYATTRTLVSAYQMVEPGEVARSHRHTPNALRLVVDASPGMFTVVNGKKIPMLPGDVVLTPSWSWHGHRNEGKSRAYWIDFLDVPLVQLLEPMFFEPFPDGVEAADEVDEHSPMRFAWADTFRRLASQPSSSTGHSEILLGPPELRSMALHAIRFEEGAERTHGRTTGNSIFAVIAGAGVVDIEDSVFEWGRGDVFVVPAWRQHRLRAQAQSYLLCVTDEPVLARLDWLRQA